MNRISRRRFAAGLGAGLLAAPFAGKLTSLRADGTRTAQRLVIFFSPNGTIHRHWRPQGSGTSFSFPAGSILAPLTAHKSDLIVCDGLDFHGVDNHVPGMSAMLTGGGGAASPTGGKSLDQYVAESIGDGSRYRSLEFGVYTSPWGSDNQTRMSYSAAGVHVEPNDDPLNQYNRLFGELTSTPGEVDTKKKRRDSINKLVTDEISDLRGRVPSVEQSKLDDHLKGLRQLLGGGAIAGLNCSTPPAAPTGLSKTNPADVPAMGKAQMDMLVLALQCGMTRVASLQWSHTTSPMPLPWLGISDVDHHSLSHSGDGDTAGVDRFVQAETWFAEQFAYLLGQLKTAQDPEGKPLLDSTLVVWAKELGDPRLHDCKSVPWVLAGGGVFDTGRYINFQGAPHNKLLVSICHAMGLSNSTFGDPSKGTGPLAELG
jgi:hypothetical protein